METSKKPPESFGGSSPFIYAVWAFLIEILSIYPDVSGFEADCLPPLMPSYEQRWCDLYLPSANK